MKNEILLEEKIRDFINEDLGFGDITTDSLIGSELNASASVIFNEEGIIAGLEEASKIFKLLDCSTEPIFKDGDLVKAGTEILRITGPANSILKGERTALNILMRMSGIATTTWRVNLKAKEIDPKIRIAATRKTVPGLRYFDKKAVELGGGDTHRLRMESCVLIKDNHITIIGSVKKAVGIAKEKVSFTNKIEVEVKTKKEAIEAVEAGANIVMLDNMEPREIIETVKGLENRGLRERIIIEASGGINETNVSQYAKTGVDIISMGSLTHSCRAVDINMDIIKFIPS